MPLMFGLPWAIATATPANPAAGSPLIYTFAAGSLYHVVAVDFQLVTGAAAANRDVQVNYLDPAGHTVALTTLQNQQGPSLTWSYHCLPNVSSQSNGTINEVQLTLADLIVPETWQLQLTFVNLQAADQIQNVVITYESLVYG